MGIFDSLLAVRGGKHSLHCPYCFSDVRLDSVHFRCSGTPAPGRKACDVAIDEVRQRYGDGTPYRPAFGAQEGSITSDHMQAQCPHCAGRTGTRLCETCHSPLPREFDKDSTIFGLLGARSSGKTVMLSVLMRELSMNGPVPNRFRHTVITHGHTNSGTSSADKLESVIRNMEMGTGTLPAQTPRQAGSLPEPVVFEWQRPVHGRFGGSGRASTIFSFYDTAGEDLASAQDTIDLRYLSAANGIILLLDPFSFPANTSRGAAAEQQNVEANVDAVLANITERLRENEGTKARKRVKQPFAVVITKIDAFLEQFPPNSPVRNPSVGTPFFDEEESQTVSDHVMSQLVSWGGSGLVNYVENNYENYRFFALSALGGEPDYQSQTVDSRGVRPHRVAEPLLWLLAQKGVIPTKEN